MERLSFEGTNFEAISHQFRIAPSYAMQMAEGRAKKFGVDGMEGSSWSRSLPACLMLRVAIYQPHESIHESAVTARHSKYVVMDTNN